MTIEDRIMKLLKEKNVDEAEIFIEREKKKRVFFEKNELKTLNQDEYTGIGLRVFLKKKQGFAHTNDLSRIEELVEEAVNLARNSQEDPYVGLPDPEEVEMVEDLYHEDVEKTTLEDTLRLGKNLVEIPRKVDSGISIDSAEVVVSSREKRILNTKGLSLTERKSTVRYFVMGMAVEGEKVSSFDYRVGGDVKIEGIEDKIKESAESFAKDILKTLGARTCESFKGSVLLSPDAFAMIFAMPISSLINAESVQERRSPWAGKLGEKVASDVLTFIDEPRKPSSIFSTSFDREGVPTRRTVIIENGVLKTYIYNTYTARKENRKSTGHASGWYRSMPSISVISPSFVSTLPLKKIFEKIDKGIYVRRFSGNANPVSGVFSGTVKGGRFIEKGEKTFPLIGTMISGSIFESLKRISAVSEEKEITSFGELPYVLVEDVSVVSK